MNVAVTRAKRHVAVICNVDCVSTDPVLKTFAEYLSTNGEVRTATQYEHLMAGSEVVRPHGMDLVLKDSTSKSSSKSASKTNKNVEKKKSEKKSKISPAKEISISGSDSSSKQLKENEKAKEDTLPERREELVKMVQKFVYSESEKVFR